MRTFLRVLAIVMMLGVDAGQVQAQTIVGDPMGDVHCSCAEIQPIDIPWLASGAELAFVCTKAAWNLDTVAVGTYWFEARVYDNDTAYHYVRVTSPELVPNGGIYTITHIPLNAPISTARIGFFNYIRDYTGVNFNWK